MTVACCYLAPEGVVFGADSTATLPIMGGNDVYLDYQQKVFEIGVSGTIGLVTWGHGGFIDKSQRAMAAEFGDELQQAPPASTREAAERWADRYWRQYLRSLSEPLTRHRELSRLATRTVDEEKEFLRLSQLAGGFIIGGRIEGNRTTEAFLIEYSPSENPPSVIAVPPGVLLIRGNASIIQRMMFGADDALIDRILRSGKWSGTPDDLMEVVREGLLQVPANLPIREAADFVYSAIFITIKGVKFLKPPPNCGGPIELAVITSDRPFRWVRHKRLDHAIDGDSVYGRC